MGNGCAMNWLGMFYQNGHGVMRDYGKAMEWYIKGANSGDDSAMNSIGFMYMQGLGVEKNYDQAEYWYKKAIKINDQCEYYRNNLDILKEERKYVDGEYKNNDKNQEQKNGCFITTAVCDSLGKSDDCYELTLFRKFRDGWLSQQKDGKNLIEEYYDVAPAIVEKINSLTNAKDVYKNICDKYLSVCLEYIEQGDNLNCKEKYVEMVYMLQKKYMQ